MSGVDSSGTSESQEAGSSIAKVGPLDTTSASYQTEYSRNLRQAVWNREEDARAFREEMDRSAQEATRPPKVSVEHATLDGEDLEEEMDHPGRPPGVAKENDNDKVDQPGGPPGDDRLEEDTETEKGEELGEEKDSKPTVWSHSAEPPTVPRHAHQKNLYETGGMYRSPGRRYMGHEEESAKYHEVDANDEVDGKYKGLPISSKSKRKGGTFSTGMGPENKRSSTPTRREPNNRAEGHVQERKNEPKFEGPDKQNPKNPDKRS